MRAFAATWLCTAVATMALAADAKAPKVRVIPLHSQEKVWVELRLSPDGPKPTKAVVRLKPKHVDPQDAVVLAQTTITQFDAGRAEAYVSFRDFFTGEYRLGVDVYQGDALIHSTEDTFEVCAKPECLKEPVGIGSLDDGCVLPPFDPVKASGNATVEVWNRTYALGELGLPAAITTQQASVLACPVTLSLVSAGKNILPTHGTPTLSKKAQGAVEYHAEASGESVSVKVTSRIEYDGFSWYSVDIAPKTTVQAEHLTLAVPVMLEHAKYLWAGGEPSVRTTKGPLQLDRGCSKVLSQDGLQWQSPFKEMVWLGDDDRGLMWFCESEEFWRPQAYAERQQALQVHRQGEVVTLRVNFISSAVELDKPVRYEFGLMATPVRPKPIGWRGWRFTLPGGLFNLNMGFTKGYKGNMLVYWPRAFWGRFYLSPLIGDEAKYRATALEDHREGRTVLPYLAPQVSGLGLRRTDSGAWEDKDPLLGRYLREWETLPTKVGHQRRGECDSPAHYLCPMSHWSDYALGLMRKHARCGADGIGILDGGSGPCSNRLHGCGYAGPQTEWRPTYSGLGVRNMCKRLLHMFIQERGRERKRITGLGLDHVHGANGKVAFGGSFFDAALKGEDLNSGYYLASAEHRKRIRQDKYYHANMLPLERFRIEFMCHQWGWVPVFMPQLMKSPGIDKAWAKSPEAAKDFLVLTLLHDCLVWPYWCNARAVFDTWMAKDKFGIADDSVEFLPYWRNQGFVRSSHERVKVSLYRKPGKIMAVVGNLSKEAQRCSVNLNLTALGGWDGRTMRSFDAVTDKPIALKDGAMGLSLPPRDYVLIILQQ